MPLVMLSLHHARLIWQRGKVGVARWGRVMPEEGGGEGDAQGKLEAVKKREISERIREREEKSG